MPERGTLDISKAKKLIGYNPINSIDKGYIKYISWYKKILGKPSLMHKTPKNPPPFVIAEIGNNHEGSFDRAKKLVREASKVGASAVKFQTFRTEYYVSKSEKKRFKQLKKFELTKKNFIYLSHMAKDLNLKFISTPFDVESAIFLSKIVDIFKISSGDNNYFDLINQVSKFNKKVIISLGLTGMKDILKLVSYLKKIGLKKELYLCIVFQAIQ